MDHQQNTADVIKGDKDGIILNDIPTVTISQADEGDEMGDIEKDLPFSHYKDTKDTMESQTESGSNETQSDTKNIPGSLKSGLKSGDSLSEGGLPGSRKVSFHSDVGSHSQPSSRKVSQNVDTGGFFQQGPFLHPIYTGIPLAPNYRRISAQPVSCFGEFPPSRKTSAEVFYYPQAQLMPPRPSQHGKVSVFSLGNASDTGMIAADAEESFPQLDHYRVSVFDNQRPTLYQLREDELVSNLIIL